MFKATNAAPVSKHALLLLLAVALTYTPECKKITGDEDDVQSYLCTSPNKVTPEQGQPAG